MRKLLLAFCMISLIACNNKQKENDNNLTKEVVSKEVIEKGESTITLEWTAFKLDDKTPVKGTFTDFEVDFNKNAKTKEERLSNSKFKIDKEGVNTEDPARDNTITEYFFKNLKGDIHGNIGELKNGQVDILISMNNKSVTKTFEYAVNEDMIELRGSIDILDDFMADTAFKALHDACSILHEGKTWTDVLIRVVVSL